MSNDTDQANETTEDKKRRTNLQYIVNLVEDAFAEYETFESTLSRIQDLAQELLDK